MNRLLIVIPAYNEEESIEEVVNNIKENYSQFDYVIVNDGSKDSTYSVCEKNKYNIIDLPINLGLAGGFQAGAKYAYLKGYDCFIQFDADGQHLPEYIEKMLKKLDEGYDIVSGQRTREGESFVGSSFARLFYFLSNRSMDVHLTDGKSELRLLSRKAMEAFVSMPEYNRFNKGLYEWIGFKEKVIPYKNETRKAGKSKFGFKKSLNYAIQGIISFNDRPLRVCIQFGFICLGLALLYLVFELMKYIFAAGNYVSGYFTTIAAIILFSGVQLIFIGILGEYIGKIYYEVKRRPHFIIEETNIEQAKKNHIG